MKFNEVHRLPRYSQAGLTLIEILIAMVLGLVVVGLIGAAVQTQIRTSDLGSALSRSQSQGNFAINELTASIRSAGYLGCAGSAGVIPRLPLSLSEPASARSSYAPIETFLIGSGGWSPSKPDGYDEYTIPGSGFSSPVIGTHALLLEGATGEGVALISDTFTAGTIDLASRSTGLEKGSMALISDCSSAEAFFIDSTGTTESGLWRVNTKAPLVGLYQPSSQYPESVRVLPYRRALYFVGNSGRTTKSGEIIRSLFEHVYPFDEFVPQEIVEGVEALVITHRQQRLDGTVQELLTGHEDVDTDLSASMRVALIVSAPTHRNSDVATPTYNLAGITLGTDPESSPFIPDDQRVRQIFEQTVNARNASRNQP